MKKQKKWLDNFGKADNANESNVSMSEDFVGLSYDTSGRNYSPAWKGQFQTGGTLPGSPGFMYARTVNPAPSEGKYAKKTMPSAQKGKEIQKQKYTESTLENIFEIFDPTGISSWNDVAAKEIEDARKKAFKTIQPSSYDDLKNMARWLTDTERKVYDDPRSEEFWRYYLKQPGDLQYLRPSKYQPTITKPENKNKNSTYYSVDDELEQAIFDSFHNKLQPNEIKQASEADISGKYNEDTLQSFITANSGLGDRNPSGSIARALGHFTVSRGKDEKGDYLSYYDTYDFPNWIQDNVKGEPYEIYGRVYYPQKEKGKKKEQGGVIKDNRGQWDHPGEITEIDSPYITMQGVPYDVLGVSDEGDTKLMEPGKDYKFKGKKVTEFPVAKLGINDLDAQPKKKLNQLLNFTNNPDKDWLKKYQ